MKKSFWLIFVLCFVILVGCGKKAKEETKPAAENSAENSALATPDPLPQPQPEPQPQPQVQQAEQVPVEQPVDLVSVYRPFAGSLYGRVAASKEGENFVFSPLAAFQEMGILYLGSDGKTKENIQRLFAAPQLKASEMGNLIGQYTTNQNAIWQFSALWTQKEYPVITLFTERVAKAFGGCNVYSADLLEAKEESLRLINAWSSDMTGDHLPVVVSDYPEQTRLMLTNILMHRVNWQKPFHMNKTSDQEFTPAEGEKVVKSMMHKTDYIPCYQSDKLQMFVLPYLEQQYRIVILMPASEQFAEFEKFISSGSLDSLFANLSPIGMTLRLPRLEMEDALDLRPFFAKTFENPNLKGMSQSDLEPLTVGPIIQKTLFKMNESGPSEIPPPPEPTIDPTLEPGQEISTLAVDRPFIFLVWHAPSMTPIIMGRVVK